MKVRISQIIKATVIYVLIIFGALTMLVPFIWMFLTSFKTYAEAIHIPVVWLPTVWKFDNYVEVLSKLNFLRYYGNTITMTVIDTIGQLFLCSLAAYAFGRLKFPGRDALFFSLLLVFMVPGQMTIIPKYIMLTKLHWVDTMLALTIPSLFSIYGTFFLRQFFMTLPKEIEESGRIDGCSYFRIYWNLLLPLCTNALIALGIFVTLNFWNELMWPLIVTSSDSLRVLSVGIATLKGQHGTQYHIMMAAATMTTVPMIAVFILGQKYFISGIAMTGIKG